MPAAEAPETDALGRLARVVAIVAIGLTLSTGLGLWLLPGDTETYWAWVIRAPLSAAFLGAGYVGAATSFYFALSAGRWSLARTSYVSALALTTLALVATARSADTFLLGAGPALPRVVAWIWLIVYVALPPLVVAVIVVQQRRGASVPRAAPLSLISTIVLAVGSIGLAALGLVLFVPVGGFEEWPWQLAPLPEQLIGAWLLTAAVTLGWGAGIERDWLRVRAATLGAVVFDVLLLIAAIRLQAGFDDTGARSAYVAVLATALVALVGVAALEGRRVRRP